MKQIVWIISNYDKKNYLIGEPSSKTKYVYNMR